MGFEKGEENKSRSTDLLERSETRLLGQSGIDLLPEVETDRERDCQVEARSSEDSSVIFCGCWSEFLRKNRTKDFKG